MLRKIGIITVVVLVLIAIGYIQLDDITKGVKLIQKVNRGTAEQSLQTKEGQEEPITEQELTQYPKLTKEELQNTLDQTPAFQDFPEEGVITLGFFDGNGVEIPDQYFTIVGKEVKTGEAQDPDFVIITGNYWVPKIQESSDFCVVFKEIKANQDYRLERNIGIIQAGIKYRSLLTYKGCLS